MPTGGGGPSSLGWAVELVEAWRGLSPVAGEAAVLGRARAGTDLTGSASSVGGWGSEVESFASPVGCGATAGLGGCGTACGDPGAATVADGWCAGEGTLGASVCAPTATRPTTAAPPAIHFSPPKATQADALVAFAATPAPAALAVARVQPVDPFLTSLPKAN